MSSGLPQPLLALLSPQAYPHPVDSVELIETHISWVLLAGAFAYKIKRPVRYAFIDLRAPERRRFFCEEELRLNRRFAPQLYLEVCEIVSVGGEARIGVAGAVLEYAVRMRRFSRADELDRLLDSHRIEPIELEAFGRALALIHARLPAAAHDTRWGFPAEVQALIVRNVIECAAAATVFDAAEEVRALQGALERALPQSTPAMAARRLQGRIRECHGDLHSGNIVRLGARLAAFDSIEYEPAFRWIDVADEIAFLTSDLAARDRPVHAHAFRSGYLAQSGDYHACRLLKLYEVHRALVRAKVAALTAGQLPAGAARAAARREFARLIGCARAALAPRKPLLILLCGLSGSGKTWLARPLAERLAAVHLRSDIERKRRAGLDELARTHAPIAQGIYSDAATAKVYEDLAAAAEDVLCGGITAVVDATFLLRGERARFAELARRLAVALRVVNCEAPAAVLRARVTARARNLGDPSEADAAVLGWQMDRYEPLEPREGLEVIRIDTAQPEALQALLARLSAPTAT